MNKLPKAIEDASIQKMFISCQEYDRLKNIESEYLKLQQNNQKTFQIGEPSSRIEQSGSGKSSSKLHKILLQESDDEDSEDIFEKIANIVKNKLEKPSTDKDLWGQPQHLASTSLALPNTTPPLSFGNTIVKNDENDKFGKIYVSILNYIILSILSQI
jgi:hypothetical protein